MLYLYYLLLFIYNVYTLSIYYVDLFICCVQSEYLLFTPLYIYCVYSVYIYLLPVFVLYDLYFSFAVYVLLRKINAVLTKTHNINTGERRADPMGPVAKYWQMLVLIRLCVIRFVNVYMDQLICIYNLCVCVRVCVCKLIFKICETNLQIFIYSNTISKCIYICRCFWLICKTHTWRLKAENYFVSRAENTDESSVSTLAASQLAVVFYTGLSLQFCCDRSAKCVKEKSSVFSGAATFIPLGRLFVVAVAASHQTPFTLSLICLA